MRVTEGQLGKDREGGALCSKNRHPTQVPERLPTQTDSTCTKGYQLTAHGPYLADGLFWCGEREMDFFFFFFAALGLHCGTWASVVAVCGLSCPMACGILVP